MILVIEFKSLKVFSTPPHIRPITPKVSPFFRPDFRYPFL
jgi:hypothetical protein